MAVAGSTVERRATRWGLFLGIAVAVVVVDQLSKAWLVANVGPGGRIEVVGDWLRLIHGRNDGGLFGLFQGSAIVLAIASLAVIGLIVAYHARSKPSVVLSVALGLLLGGAIGNLIDRLRYGYVVDFVDAGIGDLRFYTFNVADSAISHRHPAAHPARGVPGVRRVGRGSPRCLSGRAARPSGFARCVSRTAAGAAPTGSWPTQRDSPGATSRSSSRADD